MDMGHDTVYGRRLVQCTVVPFGEDVIADKPAHSPTDNDVRSEVLARGEA